MSKKKKKNDKAFREVLKGVNSKKMAEATVRNAFTQIAFDRRWESIAEDKKMIENPSAINNSGFNDIYGISKIVEAITTTKDPWSREQRRRLLESNVIYLTLPAFKAAVIASVICDAIEPAEGKVEVDKSLVANTINDSNIFDSDERGDLHLFLRNIESVTILRCFEDETFVLAKKRIMLDLETFLSGGVNRYRATKPINPFQDLANMEIPQSKQFINYMISRYNTYAGYVDVDKFNKAIIDEYFDTEKEPLIPKGLLQVGPSIHRMHMLEQWKDYQKDMTSIHRMHMLEQWKGYEKDMTSLTPINLEEDIKMSNTKIVLGRAKEGITVNGLEFLLDLDSQSKFMEFKTKEEARAYIRKEIFPDSTDEEQDDYFTFMTVDEALEYEGRVKEGAK